MNKTLVTLLISITLLLSACGGNASAEPTAEPAIVDEALAEVTAEGTLLPQRTAELAFAQGGVVKEILVQPGEVVAKDEIIASLLGVESAQAELAAAKLEQTLAQQALDAIHRNALSTSSQTEQALLNAQEAYESEANRWNLGNEDEATDLELRLDDYVIAEENYREAREKLDDVLDLDEDDHDRMDAQEDFDTEQASLQEAYADLRSALAGNDKTLNEELNSLLNAISKLEAAREMQERLNDANLDPEILTAAEARLEATTARVAAAEAAVASRELRAPFNGVLLSSDLTIGESAPPMMPVAYVADTTRWIVKTKDLAEVDAAHVLVGNPVTVVFDAFPGETFTGVVTAFDPVGKLYLGDMTYQVTITLDEPDPRFLWNMTAVVTVDTGGE